MQKNNANVFWKLEIYPGGETKVNYSGCMIIKENFLDFPDAALEISRSVSYKKSEDGAFPGVRTEDIFSEEKYHAFSQIMKETLFAKCGIRIIDGSCHFHINMPLSRNKEDYINTGWVHTDHNVSLAGVLYLNKVHDFYSGTTGYIHQHTNTSTHDLRRKFNLEKKSVDYEDYIKSQKTNNDCYHKSIMVANMYNRIILYDALMPHAPSNYVLDDKEFRLTCLLFIREYE